MQNLESNLKGLNTIMNRIEAFLHEPRDGSMDDEESIWAGFAACAEPSQWQCEFCRLDFASLWAFTGGPHPFRLEELLGELQKHLTTYKLSCNTADIYFTHGTIRPWFGRERDPVTKERVELQRLVEQIKDG